MTGAIKHLSSGNQQDSESQQGAQGSHRRRQFRGSKEPQQACLEGIPTQQWSIRLAQKPSRLRGRV